MYPVQRFIRMTIVTATVGCMLCLGACDKQINKHLKKDPYAKLFKKKGSISHAKLPYQVMSRVNMDTINDNIYQLYVSAKYRNKKPGDKSKQELLNELVDVYILAQKARQNGYHKNPKIRDRMQFLAQSVLAKLYLEELEKSITISEGELHAAYRTEYLDKDNVEYKTRHILVNTRKQATALMRELTQGADFATLARQHSKGPSRSFGGALEWFRADSVSKKFAEAVRALQVGETSPYPVKTEHGWHIILLENQRSASPPEFKDVKASLYQLIKQRRVKAAIKKLRNRSDITLSTDLE